MTTKSKTKKTTARKGSARKKTGESLVLQRTAAARQHTDYTLDSRPGFNYELAARITLILTDDTPNSTLVAIRQAVNDLARTTGIDAAYPTVVCETVPAMIAAIASGETHDYEDGTAEEMRARLLELVGRAEAGEVLPATDEPEEPHTNKHTDIPMQEINEQAAAELAEEISGGADNYDPERKALIRLVCGIAAIKDEEYRHGVAADVARIIFLNLSSIEKEVGHFVARLYAEDEQKGGTC